ncbi:MAG: hypothetical protein V1773_00490 [bacterium]
MFQREIKFIYDFTVNKIKKIGTHITYDELVNADIHPAILQYISGELSYMIYEDRQRLLKESIFDYSGKNVSNLFRLIEDELKKTKRFDAEHIARIVMYAVSFNINHLVKPQWTLLRFLFEKEESKTIIEIKQLLNYVYYYNYINSILSSYFDKKKLIAISRADFEELLLKVDNIGMDNYLPAIIENHFDGVADFFNIGGLNKTKIPLTAFELFLGEKKLYEYILLLKENYGDDLKVKVEMRDLQLLIKNHPIKFLIEKQKQMEQKAAQKTIIPENLLIKTEPKIEETGKYFVNTKIIDDKKQIKIEDEKVIQDMLIFDDVLDNNQTTNIEEVDPLAKTSNNVEEGNILEEITPDVADDTEIVIINENLNPLEDIEEEINLDKFDSVVEETIIIKNDLQYNNEENVSTETPADEVKESFIEIKTENETIENSEIVITKTEDFESSTENIEVFEIPEAKDDYEFEEVIVENEINTELMDESQSELLEVIENNQPEKHLTEELIIEENLNNLSDNQNEATLPAELEEEEIKLNFEENETVEIISKENLLLPNSVLENEINVEIKTNNKIIAVKIDINELIDKKEMKKIIEVIFNNDIEEFAETIEKMGSFSEEDEAVQFIETYCYNIGIDKNKKEAQLFKNVIKEYFSKKVN